MSTGTGPESGPPSEEQQAGAFFKLSAETLRKGPVLPNSQHVIRIQVPPNLPQHLPELNQLHVSFSLQENVAVVAGQLPITSLPLQPGNEASVMVEITGKHEDKYSFTVWSHLTNGEADHPQAKYLGKEELSGEIIDPTLSESR